MINIHGLIRGKEIEFGRDADTGGQTRYVIELINHLSKEKSIKKIDLATRLIRDKRVHSDYSTPREPITGKADIIRLPCGGYKYHRKELLWPYLDEYTDNLIAYLRSLDILPDFVHGHYADAGYVATQISQTFGIPNIFTAHSLGRNKLSFLSDHGWTNASADKEFAISTRIQTEEEILANADLVIASTQYEQDELYGQYEYRYIPSFAVIAPGLELDKFFPYYNYELPGEEIGEEAKQAHIRTQNQLRRFHFDTEKPLILSLCRPDARKNIDLLIDVYGNDLELQAIANLAIFAGIRDDITEMGEGERLVLTDILLAMDKYDLYGKMAIPKSHNPERDVPEMYRIAALKGGVFVSASYLETFGLTFIEASACGLPFIASNTGGPVDIVENCASGMLVDITEKKQIAQTIKKLLTDRKTWETLSGNGINRAREIYTWQHHCKLYLDAITATFSRNNHLEIDTEYKSIGKRFSSIDQILIADIDDTLTGNTDSVKPLLDFLKENRDSVGFGVATGRDLDSAVQVLETYGFEPPDVIISSVGTEIYYTREKVTDRGWSAHIRRKWKPQTIREMLEKLNFLTLQENPEAQRSYKISFMLSESITPENALPLIHTALTNKKLSYQLILSHGVYVDILPYRASKGHAVRYLSRKWKIPLQRILTAGNSGNDHSMLSGRMRGIVVSNHEPELAELRSRSNIYFSEKSHAAGVLEGIHYWSEKSGIH